MQFNCTVQIPFCIGFSRFNRNNKDVKPISMRSCNNILKQKKYPLCHFLKLLNTIRQSQTTVHRIFKPLSISEMGHF